MDKFRFTKREKIFLLLALFVLLMLFVSSSMTYQQYELNVGLMNNYFCFLVYIS